MDTRLDHKYLAFASIYLVRMYRQSRGNFTRKDPRDSEEIMWELRDRLRRMRVSFLVEEDFEETDVVFFRDD